jgi:hypothetical protein
MSPDEAKIFIQELKSRRPLFWQNIRKLSAQLLSCLQVERNAPRVKLHDLTPGIVSAEVLDSEVLLHCLDDAETAND